MGVLHFLFFFLTFFRLVVGIRSVLYVNQTTSMKGSGLKQKKHLSVSPLFSLYLVHMPS